jgi:taurine dioxygenase
MTYETIQASPLTPFIGAEISGIDLTKPLDNRQLHEIHEALMEHQVIFFRNQPIDLETLKRLGRSFGELKTHAAFDAVPDHPEVIRIHGDENSEVVTGEYWHTDMSCEPIPPMGSILHLHTVPPKGGGATLFASMYAAYDALSPRMQSYLEGLTATHDGALAFGRHNVTRKLPVAVHPIIAKHPVTGRKLIYINRTMVTRINELPREESAAVLAFLYEHCTRPHYQVRFQWEKDSIAFWDNRCAQHQAIWDYYPHVRSGYRVQINGTGPVLAA